MGTKKQNRRWILSGGRGGGFGLDSKHDTSYKEAGGLGRKIVGVLYLYRGDWQWDVVASCVFLVPSVVSLSFWVVLLERIGSSIFSLGRSRKHDRWFGFGGSAIRSTTEILEPPCGYGDENAARVVRLGPGYLEWPDVLLASFGSRRKAGEPGGGSWVPFC